MRAAQYIRPGRIECREIPDTVPGPGEVTIAVEYCGICGTDVHIFKGHMDQRVHPPQAVGHEMSGKILRLGDGVTEFRIGDAVTVRPLDNCGSCNTCRAGFTHICEKLKFLGIETPGAFAEEWVVPARLLHRLPDNMPMDLAALVEPAAVACHDVRRSGLKEGDFVVVNGGGPIGTVLVDAYSDGHVRGFVSNPHVHYQYNDTGKLAVGIAVGKEGTLEVIKDLGMKENWSGTVELQSGEIGDDFAYYFTVSEQTPSAVSVGVLVDTDNHIISAGGLIVQMMPDATEEDIRKCEEVLSKLQPMSTLIRDKDSLEDILHEMFDDVKILSSQDICFKCHCSKATMKRVLTTLSKEERMKMIEEDHGCEITCNFCNERYHFSEEELRDLERFIETYARD